ncbi:hypothetical protein GCM10011534_23670 [Pseudooceanicola nanhaiensis]|jgi:hypothetical protein|uniref:DUF1413 domain-containing protein n=1 Tax=Pseudooceanicola nanhaiensis TaxID=375761 RepID=A0A917SYE3_9RHOB|nr:DUF1413 domain-containing protein [Pseudooceanicola nanhaiensis]GGM01104.1 hypothetical protein GCM10011534_23670 [Pseudooceanicola nanhaiensis]
MDDAEISRLRARLKDLSAGPFHFPEVYGPGWDDLPIGEKVRRGHGFLDLVRSGAFPQVTDTGEKAGGGRLYRKRAS